MLLSNALSAAVLAFLAASPAAATPVELTKRQYLKALDPWATAEQTRYQPSLDFDKDSCYHVPVIDAAGTVNQGLPYDSPIQLCKKGELLSNTNVYARSHCAGIWCVYIYDYYFEFDWPGHRHDIEHIAVVTKNGNRERVSVSCHGKWNSRSVADTRWHETSHPKIVFHKDGAGTHCFRYANPGDDKIENAAGHWFRGALVGWNLGIRVPLAHILNTHSFGKAGFAIKESTFWGAIKQVCPEIPL